ncbi:hypothetical protein PV10_07761 [Exophiala mesophila]|uniref:Dynactin subunit 2 n=1 Tax=Exophiala mesophila TaxID=212818 RepID=A0A0D1Z8U9_EXOME|nr:uncharacterized protein PV10_07761 [Exophiala mesophila]KIV90454.1 hypothetical protein PV10_07761 [Exophiala mesophila]
MALGKKYAGLPDLDAAPEVYETPDLADDVSTAQTTTLRTLSSDGSDASDDDQGERVSNRQNLDRRPLDREQARRRFAGSRVDARNVDFSDHVGGTRGSYRTRSSRRRRRARRADIEGEDIVESSDSEEEETVSRKIARLRREAEEVRLELDRLEAGNQKDAEGEFVDSLEQQQQQQTPTVDTYPERDQVQELSRLLDGLSSKSGSGGRKSTEDRFLSRLNDTSRSTKPESTKQPDSELSPPQSDADSKSSAMSAVAAFADRLTSLESALGVSTASTDSPATSILSTLERLSTQINTIHTTLNPKDGNGATTNTTTSTPTTYDPAFLESISAKLRTLTRESAELDQSRRKARDTLDELQEKRAGLLISASIQHGMQPRRGYGGAGSGAGVGGTSGDDDKNRDRGQETIGELNRPDAESQALTSKLFLEDQSARITALYQTLPSIQRLQPLLPVVLERLRGLNIVHVGAAEAKNSLDELEKRQAELKAEVAQWREAVTGVESGIKDLEHTMRDNVKVVGGMVANLEERMGDLDKGAKGR